MPNRPSRAVIAAHVGAVVAAVVVAVLMSGSADWDPGLMVALFGFSVLSDLTAVSSVGSKIKISGSFLALVVAMVFLGGPPAALLGTGTIALGWLRWREAPHYFLNNLATYAWVPLLGGLAFRWAHEATNAGKNEAVLYLLVLGLFAFSLALNFILIAGYSSYLDRISIWTKVDKVLMPGLASEAVAAVLALAIVHLYMVGGAATVALLGIALYLFQILLGKLFTSEARAEELEVRTQQLAALQIGVLTSFLRGLDLRDRMTARHSAAVARYSREIAQAAGLSEREQELVHTAALLHDIGKFVWPDTILKGGNKLTDEEFAIVKQHPEVGARIVTEIEGYGPVGEVILAHHERIDGRGYPNGIEGDAIPVLSRIISVADTYDVMTARDSYRRPVSSFEAIQELRRVAGSQLDEHLVEVFIELLSGKDVAYRHGEDADFDAELHWEHRVREYADPRHAEPALV
jgi:putative nucleotidyltransferase with HDIG domain